MGKESKLQVICSVCPELEDRTVTCQDQSMGVAGSAESETGIADRFTALESG